MPLRRKIDRRHRLLLSAGQQPTSLAAKRRNVVWNLLLLLVLLVLLLFAMPSRFRAGSSSSVNDLLLLTNNFQSAAQNEKEPPQPQELLGGQQEKKDESPTTPIIHVKSTDPPLRNLAGDNTPVQATPNQDDSTHKEEPNAPPPPPQQQDVPIIILPPPPPPQILFFGPTVHINDSKDAFSASWLQSRPAFMAMPFEQIISCEDAAFVAYWNKRVNLLRMTVDWLDFSVEHLSKWFKLLNVIGEGEDQVFQTLWTKLDQYVSNHNPPSHISKTQIQQPEQPLFQPTIAVIAFQAYDAGKQSAEKAHKLTLIALAATMESLRRAGFGRVVVVGLEASDAIVVQDTFRYLQRKVQKTNTDNTNHQNNVDAPIGLQSIPGGVVDMVGHMEVAFVQGSKEIAKAQWVSKNVPKATVIGLRHAFQMADKAPALRLQNETDYIHTWLGTRRAPSYWKYVYLTEPDTILQMRHSSKPQIQQIIDAGKVMTPHRWQPIPHERDAQGSTMPHAYLPSDFAPIVDLQVHNDNDNAVPYDVCCDAWKGHDTKPGLPPLFPDCGNFWYLCDFGQDKYQKPEAHQRLKPYGLVRIQGGTGIVTLAASESGRPCTPQKQSVCLPKP